MISLLLVGLFILLIGVLLMVAPDLLFKISDHMNRAVFKDRSVYAHHTLVAIVCLVVGVMLLVIYYQYLHHM